VGWETLVKPFLELRDGGGGWERQREGRGEIETRERGQENVDVGGGHDGRLELVW
jgi:hypothetical protein